MQLKLTGSGYKKFLKAFRQADIDNEGSDREIQVDYAGGAGSQVDCSFFFTSPNFKLVAYRRTGHQRVNLTTYNHVNNIGTKDLAAFIAALKVGGGSSTQMTAALSMVVIITSEAARSRVVEDAMHKVIFGASIDINRYEFLFKAYNQPARYNGYLNNSGYTDHWRPLKKEDYSRFFNSGDYTGDQKATRSSLALV